MIPFLLLLGLAVYVLSQDSQEGATGGFVANSFSALMQAIAKAEGFYVPGSIPQRANNPGDLKLGDKGLGTISGITIFGTATEGWAALERQLKLMASGASRVYSPDWTLQQIAAVWVGPGGGDSAAWAAIVAGALGVDPQATLPEILA